MTRTTTHFVVVQRDTKIHTQYRVLKGRQCITVLSACNTRIAYKVSNFVVEALDYVDCVKCRTTEAFRNKLLEQVLTK